MRVLDDFENPVYLAAFAAIKWAHEHQSTLSLSFHGPSARYPRPPWDGRIRLLLASLLPARPARQSLAGISRNRPPFPSSPAAAEAATPTIVGASRPHDSPASPGLPERLMCLDFPGKFPICCSALSPQPSTCRLMACSLVASCRG